MDIHEYQAKEVLTKVRRQNRGRRSGLQSRGKRAAGQGNRWECMGGQSTDSFGSAWQSWRYKGMQNHDEVRAAAEEFLGKNLVTRQTGPAGKVCSRGYMLRQGMQIVKEMYLCFLIDRSFERIVMIGSGKGGMEIEELTRTNPSMRSKKFISNLLLACRIFKHARWPLL